MAHETMHHPVVESNDSSDSFQPEHNCPTHWPEKVMGHNIGGVSGPLPTGVDYTPELKNNPNEPITY